MNLALAAALIVANNVAAEPHNAAAEPEPIISIQYGQDLARFCAGPSQSSGYRTCFSLVGTVLDVATSEHAVYGLKTCIAPPIGTEKAVALTIAWLRRHPADDIQAASYVVAEALNAAYPCQKDN